MLEFGSSCHISLKADRVSQLAVQALFDLLMRASFSRYVLSFLNEDGRLELFSSRIDVFQKIEAAVEKSRRPRPDDYLAEANAAPPPPAVVALQNLLRRRPVDLSDGQAMHDLSARIKEVFKNRFIVAEEGAMKPEVVFSGISDGLFAFMAEWRSNAIGKPVADIPDKNYGDWIAQSYKKALFTQQPAIEKVDAIVCLPRMGRLRLRYGRVLLPFRDASGKPMLVSGTADDNRIDLRVRTG